MVKSLTVTGRIRSDLKPLAKTLQYINKFKEVHGDFYDYSNTIVYDSMTKIEVVCPVHGAFTQRPGNHMSGNGCPKCGRHNQNILYVIRCKDTSLVKIGITNNLKARIRSIGGNLEYIYHITTKNPKNLEIALHAKYSPFNQYNNQVKNGGTEFFQLSEPQVEELLCFLSQHQDQ